MVVDPFEDLKNHSQKCRLCLNVVEDEQKRVSMTENIRLIIFEIQIQASKQKVKKIIFY